MTSRIALPLSLLFISLNAYAEPIIADRPGFSTGTHTVAPGHYNIELGVQGLSGSRSIPLSNVRIGVTSVAELEVQWGGWQFANGSTTVGDLSVGAKYRVLQSDTINLSLLGLLTLPSGNGQPAGSHAAPLAAALWNHDASGLFGMFQIASNNQDRMQTQLQAAIGKSFNHNDQLGSYIELYFDHPLNHAGSDSIMLDGGYAYLLDSRTQLDVHIGLDVNGNAADFIGFGFARSY